VLNEKLIGKDMEGSDCGIIEAVFRNFPGTIRE
jgi:hypothetical protein